MKQTNQQKQKAKSKKKSNNTFWIGLAAVLLFGGIAWYTLRATGDADFPQKPGLAATLSPALFSGKTRQAYQAAREVPEVLHEIPCFCGCMRNPGHQSNLDCYKDDHSSHCAMCQDIALDAAKMHKEGSTIQRIRDAIVAKYASFSQ